MKLISIILALIFSTTVLADVTSTDTPKDKNQITDKAQTAVENADEVIDSAEEEKKEEHKH